ncbi:MAG: hypothetical protein ACPG4T_06560 [Nannocystaceae bacterium]
MPRSPEDIRRRLQELLDRCDQFFSGTTLEAPVKITAPKSELWRFLISALQTVSSACGADSPHLRELELCREQLFREKGAQLNLDIDTCRGVLMAARDDFDAGMLLDVRQLVAAEAFGDLLESAGHLLDENHHLPAVSISAAVLESSLRDFADRHSVSWQGHSSITKINTELYKARLYDKTVFAEIEAWARLRNKVAHGDFKTPDDVDLGAARRMVDGVRQFVLKYR